MIVDVETTGLSTSNDKIIEIAASKMIDGHYIGSFSSLVHFPGQLTSDVKKTTNITEDMLRKAPSATFVLNQFVNFVGDSVMMAHNASFDSKIIYHELVRHGIDLPPCFSQQHGAMLSSSGANSKGSSGENSVEVDESEMEFMVVATSDSSNNSNAALSDDRVKREAEQIGFICTLLLSRRLMPELSSHKLSDLLAHIGKPQHTAHRALPDTQMTMYLWRYFERTIYSRLGFYPPMEFYKQLTLVKSSQVDLFIKNYKALNEKK